MDQSIADDLLIDAESDSVPPPARPGGGRILLGLSLVLIAFNLRPVFSSLSALLPEVMHDTGLSPGGASSLTILPVLCLGLFAPLAPVLARRIGTERTLLGAVLLVALGTGLRGLASVPALLAGSALAGAGIAVGNVLLPGMVKRDFPDRAALMTGFYTMALCTGAACAAGLTVPIDQRLGGAWGWALACWAVPAVVAGLVWAPRAFSAASRVQHAGHVVRGLWRDRLAWQVTLFMGLQSALAYSVFGWLAPILRDRGLDAVTAGLVVSVSVIFQVAASLLAPSLAVRFRNQSGIAVALAVIALVPLLGLLFAPLSTVWLWSLPLGIGQGGLFALALTFIVLRSPDSAVAAELSAMAQGVGYVLAAGGPLLVGLLHDWTGGYGATGALFIVLTLGIALSGFWAGRMLQVGATAVPR